MTIDDATLRRHTARRSSAYHRRDRGYQFAFHVPGRDGAAGKLLLFETLIEALDTFDIMKERRRKASEKPQWLGEVRIEESSND